MKRSLKIFKLFNSFKNKFDDIKKDYKELPIANENFLDAILAPVFFVTISRFQNLQTSIILTGSLIIFTFLYRILRKESLRNSLIGVGGTSIALLIAQIQGTASGFFLPGIIRDLSIASIGFVTILMGRPFTIYTSKSIRGWPLGWFLHEKVKPAYREVAIIWVVFLGLKGLVQLYFFSSPEILAVIKLATSNQTTIFLLVLTYIYGQKKLIKLGGPSVEEYRKKISPPWSSQQSGF